MDINFVVRHNLANDYFYFHFEGKNFSLIILAVIALFYGFTITMMTLLVYMTKLK